MHFLKAKEKRILEKVANDEKSPVYISKTPFNEDKENEIITDILNEVDSDPNNNNALLNNSFNIRWLKWKDNVCKYDTFITLFLTTFETSKKKCLNICNILGNSLNKCSLELNDINSDLTSIFGKKLMKMM